MNTKKKIKSDHKKKASSYFQKHIKELANVVQYSKITFHLILFPVPEVQKMKNEFIKKAKSLRDE